MTCSAMLSKRNLLTVGIDASRSTSNIITGTENYSINLTKALINSDPHFNWHLYFRDAPTPALFPKKHNVSFSTIPFPFMWTHLRLGFELAVHPPDGVFVPAHVLPLFCKVPSIVTVHDLGFMLHPSMHPTTQRLYLLWSTKQNVLNASHLIADSLSTQKDIIKHYNIDRNKISVVYPGFNPSNFQNRPTANLPSVPNKYILYVGTLHPRKGLLTLIDAFAQLTNDYPDLHLVFAGRNGWMVDQIQSKVDYYGLNNKIVFLGFVPQQQLPFLYNKALVTVLPSLYEGFGYTPLESMAAGTPVVCTSAGSLPEVVGNAALIVKPADTKALFDALVSAISNDSIRKDLISKGLVRCKNFSWTDAANKTIDIMQRVFGSI